MAENSKTLNVRGVSLAHHERLTNAASAADQTQGAWLMEAIDEKALRQAGTSVLPPVTQGVGQAIEAPAPPVVPLDLAGLGAMISAVVAAAQIAGTAALAREAELTLRQMLRQARGVRRRGGARIRSYVSDDRSLTVGPLQVIDNVDNSTHS